MIPSRTVNEMNIMHQRWIELLHKIESTKTLIVLPHTILHNTSRIALATNECKMIHRTATRICVVSRKSSIDGFVTCNRSIHCFHSCDVTRPLCTCGPTSTTYAITLTASTLFPLMHKANVISPILSYEWPCKTWHLIYRRSIIAWRFRLSFNSSCLRSRTRSVEHRG